MSVTHSSIEWCDATWNPLRGCLRASTGCEQCYAEKIAGRFSGPRQPFAGLAKRTSQGFHWTGKVELIEKDLEVPLRWKTPKRIFTNSMSDLFYEGVPVGWIARIVAVMALAHRHTFQVLTKRAKRMRDYLHGAWLQGRIGTFTEEIMSRYVDPQARRSTDLRATYDDALWPLPNVWWGVSAENQGMADARLPHLLETPAAVRFVSAEPLLGPVDLTPYLATGLLHWVVVGGESGSRTQSRPCDVAWIRSLVQQCREYGVACFTKQVGSRPFDSDYQWGLHAPYDTRSRAIQQALGMDHVGFNLVLLKDHKGGDFSTFPADIAVRQFPEVGHATASADVADPE